MKFFNCLVPVLIWCMTIMHFKFSECFATEMKTYEASDISKRSLEEGSKRAHHDRNCFRYMDAMSHARDCDEIQASCSRQALVSGIFTIHPDEYPTPFLVYCDFDNSSGWTVFQRRLDGSVDFEQDWNEYRNGFGFMNSEFWLGNEKLSFITAQKKYELRIELTNPNGDPFHAIYTSFRVGHENTHFKLLLGEFSGNATSDSLDHHRNSAFTTYDQDNDNWSAGNCASPSHHGGGWWFNECDYSNLNGMYGVNSDGNPGGIEWTYLPGGSYGLKSTEMKIRPVV